MMQKNESEQRKNENDQLKRKRSDPTEGRLTFDVNKARVEGEFSSSIYIPVRFSVDKSLLDQANVLRVHPDNYFRGKKKTQLAPPIPGARTRFLRASVFRVTPQGLEVRTVAPSFFFFVFCLSDIKTN
jgi:hypothetical protein